MNKSRVPENKDNGQYSIWNINRILSHIFMYIDNNDLIEFNTVNKRWNHLTNPIIHKSIKLQRRRTIQNKVHGKILSKSAKVDAEVEMCIDNNLKHAQFIKEFKYTEKLEIHRAIQFFEKFIFIENLTIERVVMSQDQFIGMIIPLTQLRRLSLTNICVKNIINNRYITEAADLPPALKKLNLVNVSLIGNPVFFVKTINSHSNLVEFSYDCCIENSFLNPFFKSYPTLKIFEYIDENLENAQSLIRIFESNPQLIKLTLELKCWNSILANDISRHLTNLEEFNLIDIIVYHEDLLTTYLKFTQATKIKKLKLKWDRLSVCSLEFILMNCPHLEDLSLIFNRSYLTPDSFISLNLDNLTNIKNLAITCDNLSDSSLDNILRNCPHLVDLDIFLPTAWKKWMNIIGLRCDNLMKLKICPSGQICGEEKVSFFQELNSTRFLCNSSGYKDTLTHLILNQFNFYNSKAEYFENFPNLKSIKFPLQIASSDRKPKEEINIDKYLWPNYRFLIKDEIYNFDIELVRL